MSTQERVRLGHGGGGRLARSFLESEIISRFGSPALAPLDDAALVEAAGARLAFTTDGFVVKPPDVPGGDIGKLAVCGTVNDLAVSGARPLHVSLAAIVEEGLPMSALGAALDSAAAAARLSGVQVVCGDTKVVPRGEADGLFLTTAGIGTVDPAVRLGVERVVPGDRLIVSGTVGQHGAAVLAARGELGEVGGLESDCAPVSLLTEALLGLGEDLRFMRDPTRGGLMGVVHEIASGRPVSVHIDEESVPVARPVTTLCELAGLDPLLMACEGRVVAAVSPEGARRALERIRKLDEGRDAAIIGEVTAEPVGRVVMHTVAGTSRLVVLPEEDPLPRIC